MSERGGSTTVDVVVPVFNALADTRACLEAVLAHGSAYRFSLWIVDDGSDSATAAFLREVANNDARVVLLHNPHNQGFVRSANRGMLAGSAEYVALLNSDVIVPEGWLDRLVDVARRDPTIATVNPLTNRASQIDLVPPPGANVVGIDQYLRNRPPRIADIVTGVGFCILIRRAALAIVGPFDEIFGRGYCEESDFCMRLLAAGWRTVVTDNVYVHHRGSASFRDRDARYLHNRRIFDDRWRAEYQRRFRAFRTADPLRHIRKELSAPRVPDPMPAVWETGRALRKAVTAPTGASAKSVARAALRILGSRRQTVDSALVARLARPGRPSVTYLVPNLVIAGGVLSVVQLVNRLVLAGVDARIATRFVDPAVRRWMPLLSEPMVWRSADRLCDRMPRTDVVVATHWSSADWALRAKLNGRAREAVYFVQDYEPWFFAEADSEGRRKVEQSYAGFAHLVAKSDWLADLLRGHTDGLVHKIPIGMDLDTFYPRDVARSPRKLVAMARPQTPRRGFGTLVQALREVASRFPDVEIELFGDDTLDSRDLGFRFRSVGVVSEQSALAQMYSTASVFVDSSDFQGFGRCTLEAMACGAAAVVTDVGGVSEYARHGHTALLSAPRDPAAIAANVARLFTENDTLQGLQRAGVREAGRFPLSREVDSTRALFESLAATP